MTLERFGTDTPLTWREGAGGRGSPVPRSIPSAARVSSILGDKGYNRKRFSLEPMCFFVVIPKGPFLHVVFKIKILLSGHYSLFIRYYKESLPANGGILFSYLCMELVKMCGQSSVN